MRVVDDWRQDSCVPHRPLPIKPVTHAAPFHLPGGQQSDSPSSVLGAWVCVFLWSSPEDQPRGRHGDPEGGGQGGGAGVVAVVVEEALPSARSKRWGAGRGGKEGSAKEERVRWRELRARDWESHLWKGRNSKNGCVYTPLRVRGWGSLSGERYEIKDKQVFLYCSFFSLWTWYMFNIQEMGNQEGPENHPKTHRSGLPLLTFGE